MTFVDYFLNKKIRFGVIIIILTIIAILSAIIIIDKTKSPSPAPKLAEYNTFIQKANDLKKNNKISSNPSFNKFLNMIASLNTPGTTKEQQLNTLKWSWTYLYGAYEDTNEHDLNNLSIEYNNFVRDNFPDQKLNFVVACLDESCAKESTPKEILSIIDEINKSNLQSNLKSEYVQNLKTFSYINDTDTKVIDYLGLAVNLGNDPDLTKSGLNITIKNELLNYLNKTYPDYYSKYANKMKLQITK